MSEKKYRKFIGLEIHVCLKNVGRKLFSKASLDSDNLSKPNTFVDLFDLGVLGTFPLINEKCVKKAIEIALALNCNIAKVLYFERKHYFYLDIRKKYQITQKTFPIGFNGFLKKFKIKQAHLEEDTASIVHAGKEIYIDHNRAGRPLLEIVTEVLEVENPNDISDFLLELIEILRYLGLSVEIHEGDLRVDTNISVLEVKDSEKKILTEKDLGPRVELKNIGALTSVQDAAMNEFEFQINTLENGGKVERCTKHVNLATGKSEISRQKEEEHEYRYKEEPNFIPSEIKEEYIEQIRKNLPILPEEKRKDYLYLGENTANILIKNRNFIIFELLLRETKIDVKKLSNIYINYLVDKKFNLKFVSNLIEFFHQLKINDKTFVLTMKKVLDENIDPFIFIEENKLWQISDENLIKSIIDKVFETEINITENENKQKMINFFIGKCMKINNKLNPYLLEKFIKEKTNKIDRRENE